MIKTSKTGSLPVAILFALALLAVVLSVLDLSGTSFRLSKRNEYRAQARAVAESELEHLFYLFKGQIDSGKKAFEVPSELAKLGVLDGAAAPATDRQAYLSLHRDDSWVVRRSMNVNAMVTEARDSNGDVGDITYVDVRVEVEAPPNSPWYNAKNRGIAPIHFGRQFSATVSTVFQNAVFYQGDLEIAPGNATQFGTILVNGNVFIGASPPNGSVELMASIRFPKTCAFNTKDAGADGNFNTGDDTGRYITYRKPDTPTGSNLLAPTFTYSLAQQVQPMDEQSNFLGGANANAVQAADPSLFPTVNDVYRSVIVPPPSAGNTNEYSSPGSLTESPSIANTRIYNRADIVVTVESNGSVSITSRPNGSDVDVTTKLKSIVSQQVNMYDYREKKTVSVTEIDLKVLKNLIAAGAADPVGGNPKNFKGVVYVNLKKGSASAPAAVRLVNAPDLPRSGVGGNDGFSFVTNGGLYVKGDYNTTKLADGTYPRSMLMADAMTVLSDSWSDAVANADKGNATPDITKRVVPAQTMTINSALMLGNTSATKTTASGGVQNLVRYLEDWKTNKCNVKFFGSIGRLFDSKMFISSWVQPGSVYIQPENRYFEFDEALRVNGGPPGSIRNTRTSRGRFFEW